MKERPFITINSRAPNALQTFKRYTEGLLYREMHGNSQLVVLCIGSDRSTGDSLGPLVGTFLIKKRSPAFSVYGTLEKPIHAVNLRGQVELINNYHKAPFTVAVDACLGRPESVGCIEIGAGPLSPGAGVNKNLPPVGDIFINGIVNVGGFLEQAILQSTGLYNVIFLAEIISNGLFLALEAFSQKKKEALQAPVISTDLL